MSIHDVSAHLKVYPSEYDVLLKVFNNFSREELAPGEENTFYALLDAVQEFVLANR